MSDTVAASYTFVAITCPPVPEEVSGVRGLADGSWGLGSSIVNLGKRSNRAPGLYFIAPARLLIMP